MHIFISKMYFTELAHKTNVTSMVNIMLEMVYPGVFVEASERLEHGRRMIYAGIPASQGCGVRGRSCSNVVASTVMGLKFRRIPKQGPIPGDHIIIYNGKSRLTRIALEANSHAFLLGAANQRAARKPLDLQVRRLRRLRVQTPEERSMAASIRKSFNIHVVKVHNTYIYIYISAYIIIHIFLYIIIHICLYIYMCIFFVHIYMYMHMSELHISTSLDSVLTRRLLRKLPMEPSQRLRNSPRTCSTVGQALRLELTALALRAPKQPPK